MNVFAFACTHFARGMSGTWPAALLKRFTLQKIVRCHFLVTVSKPALSLPWNYKMPCLVRSQKKLNLPYTVTPAAFLELL